jgi:hypothetical protein
VLRSDAIDVYLILCTVAQPIALASRVGYVLLMDPNWNPDVGDHPDLVRSVASAARRFREELGPQQLVFGVGVAPVPWSPRPVLLILLDWRAVGLRELSAPPFVPFPLVEFSTARERLRGWELPLDTAALPATAPQALGSPALPVNTGDAIRGLSLIRGTAGPPVHLPATDESAFLTAGHVTGTTSGATVERLLRRRFRSRLCEVIGDVAHASDPVETPRVGGYDVSVVRVRPDVRLGMKSRVVARLPAMIPAPHTARLLGGVSGAVPVALVGALMVLGDGERLWKNSWTMIPSGVAAQGDSGAAVIDANGALLGILVGGSSYPRSTAMAVQYVQDAEAIERDYFPTIGVRFS